MKKPPHIPPTEYVEAFSYSAEPFVDSVYYPGERKVYLAQYRDRKGMPHDLRPGSEVCFYWCPTLSGQIWITDENGVENFGVAPALKTAAWADPESIKVAVGQRQRQMAELMADTRARHADSHVARVAAENVNRALIKEAEAAKIAGPRSDGEGYSLEDLAGADEAPAVCAAADCAESDTDSYSLDELNAV